MILRGGALNLMMARVEQIAYLSQSPAPLPGDEGVRIFQQGLGVSANCH